MYIQTPLYIYYCYTCKFIKYTEWIRGSGGPPRGGTLVDVGMVVWLFDQEVATYSLCRIWLLNKIWFRWFGSLASLCIIVPSQSLVVTVDAYILLYEEIL